MSSWFNKINQSSEKNDEGFQVKLGSGGGSLNYYCGRWIGKQNLPDSDGYCGKNSGPQCNSCLRYQDKLNQLSNAPKNSDGNRVYLTSNYYCGRWFGSRILPGSDGHCGPNDGPQCRSCKIFRPTICNDEGAPIKLGSGGGAFLYYCGRLVGKSNLPGSDGYCGANNGPQCNSCLRYQDRVNQLSNETKNGDGVIIRMTNGNFYCGRWFGKLNLIGSDGHCGPNDGPQCNTCRNYQYLRFNQQTFNPNNQQTFNPNNQQTFNPNNQQTFNPYNPPQNNNQPNEPEFEIDENKVCKVCMDQMINSVFIPCGHLCCCYECAQSCSQCPICRAHPEKIVKTFYV